MTATRTTTTSSTANRRIGYAIAVAVNGALLFGVNVRPGWRILPFLTEDLVQVLWLINLGFVAGIVVNAVYLVVDRGPVRAVGDLVTTAIGLAGMVRLLQVFPFAFPAGGLDWALIVRVLLILGVVGTAIALVVALVTLTRLLVRS